MRKQKLITLITAVALTLGSMILPTPAADTAEDWEVLVEESFDDYTAGYEGSNTLLKDHFKFEANDIGEGSIRIFEEDSGNLGLLSQVFTHVYSTTPLPNGYTFSLDVNELHGEYQAAIFLRSPAFEGDDCRYETDGFANGLCAGRTGALLFCHANDLQLLIKSYSLEASETKMIASTLFTFDLPEGVSFNSGTFFNVRVEDDGTLTVSDTKSSTSTTMASVLSEDFRPRKWKKYSKSI